jgi:hypothetical protein
LRPRTRKNPATVAERKMRMTRSGHIFSRLGTGWVPCRPTKQSIRRAAQRSAAQRSADGGIQEWRRLLAARCSLSAAAVGSLGDKCCNGGLGREVVDCGGGGWIPSLAGIKMMK